MIDRQLRSRGIVSSSVLDAMASVPREKFVPDSSVEMAYEDCPLPIGLGQTISQPYIVAYMTEALQIKPTDRILEIGTGSGYQTAVLSELADTVFSIEIIESLYRQAKKRLDGMGIAKIRLKLGDGRLGWPDEAPFDKIILTASPEKIPGELIRQLKEGGRLVAPVGKAGDVQTLVVGVKAHGTFKTSDTIAVRFVPLTQEKAADEGLS